MNQRIRLFIFGAMMLLSFIMMNTFDKTPNIVNSQTIFPDIDYLVPEVIRTLPHDGGAFTQGLLIEDGIFYESTGQNGESTFRQVDLETGEVLYQFDLDATYFGEGLALTDQWFIQLTWRSGQAFVYDRTTLEPLGFFEYTGEGWGLCYDGQFLYHSDGSETITIRDPNTFGYVGQLTVTIDTISILDINELECVGDSIYANVWNTDRIVRIDKATGEVTAIIDASGLLTPEQQQEANERGSNAVLNGIAYNTETESFYLTGKRWDRMFEVFFVSPNNNE